MLFIVRASFFLLPCSAEEPDHLLVECLGFFTRILCLGEVIMRMPQEVDTADAVLCPFHSPSCFIRLYDLPVAERLPDRFVGETEQHRSPLENRMDAAVAEINPVPALETLLDVIIRVPPPILHLLFEPLNLCSGCRNIFPPVVPVDSAFPVFLSSELWHVGIVTISIAETSSFGFQKVFQHMHCVCISLMHFKG